jgi:hypothetical protein
VTPAPFRTASAAQGMRDWMDSAGLRVEDVAAGVGAPALHVEQWLAGAWLPSLPHAQRLEVYSRGVVDCRSWVTGDPWYATSREAPR